MKRLFFAVVLILGLTLLTGCDGGKTADKNGAVELKLGHVTQVSHPYHYAVEHFAERVSEKTDGRIKVTIYPARQLGGDRDMLEMVQNGSLDIGAITTAVFGGFTPLLDALQIPYLIDSYDTLDIAIPNQSSEDLLTGLDDINVKGLAILEGGMRHFVMKDGPVTSLDDLKGKKMRVSESPLLMDFISSLGANPTPLPYGEIYSSLQTGVVDGLDMDIVAVQTERFYEVAKDVTYSGHFSWPFALVMSKKAWSSLSPEDQKIIEEAAMETVAFNHKNIREMEEESVAFLKEQGVSFHTMNLEPFKEVSAPVGEKFMKKDPRIKAFYEEVTDAKKS